ncbi:MAG: flagellar hook-basal body complex protein [Candidatus Scalindua sp.]|jgi:flagellar hook protein FlgE|nr:flagellar hook-basal body complex protein [Candidatus Scalindua sp.]
MSTSSLVAGISGLKTSQVALNVIGDNLANLNTSGFKSSRVNFANELSQTMRSALAPSGGLGGRNPIQVGTGTKVSSIDKDFSQGNMSPTGRPLDLAIQGDGFFMLSDGTQNYFSRVGSFNLDKNNDLVDSGTGLKVQGTSGVAINVPVNATEAGKATTKTTISGNLNSEFTSGAVNHVSTSASAYATNGSGTTTNLAGTFTTAGTTTATTPNTTGIQVGDIVSLGGDERKVVSLVANTSITVDSAFTTSAAYATPAIGAGALTGSIDPAASTTVTGVGTLFTSELAVGDQITVSGETRTISAIASNTSLTVSAAFSNNANDTSVMTDSMAVADLNDLSVNTTDYVAGDKINIVGQEHDGSTVSKTFVYGNGAGQNGTTLGAFSTFASASFGSATASIDTSGNLLLTADQAGQSELTINIADATTNTGATTYNSFAASTTGTGDVYVSSIPIFDTQGSSHLVSLSYEKTASNTWSLTPSMKSAEGSVTTALTSMTFNANGSFASATGTPTITVTYPDATTQTVTLDFGTPNTFGGLTQFGGTGSAAAISQDGYEEGFFSSTSTNPDGTVVALFTNGKTKNVGQLQLVTFSNPAGLSTNGNNLLSPSLASGSAVLKTAQSGRVGSILSGVLESSNVDIAEEFTKLIVSQRAFQANSRTITTTDEVLQELVNIVR